MKNCVGQDFGYWMDCVVVRPVNTYDRIRYAWKEGSSVAETEERIRNLIRHAVKTTDFYKDYPEDTPLEKLPVVNKDTFRQHYDSFISSTYKDAEDNRVMCTSGSTGTPLRMIQNKEQNLSQYCRWYFSRGSSRILYWNERSILSVCGVK